MAWFNIDDKMWSHPKFIGLPPVALELWVRSGAWAAGHLTDGFVPNEAIPLLGKRTAIGELVARGLWLEVDGGYQFHDWSDWQRTREQVEADRAAAKERQRKWREGRTRKTKAKTTTTAADRSVDEVIAMLDKRAANDA